MVLPPSASTAGVLICPREYLFLTLKIASKTMTKKMKVMMLTPANFSLLCPFN